MTTHQNNINNLPIAVVVFDADENILEYSVPFNQWSINTLNIGNTLSNTLGNDTYLQIREYVRLARSGQNAECDVQLNSGDGNYYRVYIAPIKDHQLFNCFMLSAVPNYADNTKQATQKQTDRYLRVTMDTIDQGITIYNKNLELVAWNPVYERMQIFPPEFTKFGFPLKQAYKGIAELGVFGQGDPEKLANKHIESIRTREMIAEEELYPPTGRVIKIHRYYLPDGGMCATFTDITEQKINDQKLFHQANFDPLTNIPNRYSILNQIQTNTQFGEENDSFCLLFLDLDYFKLVNDTFGHHTGDILLKEVTRRIVEQIDQEKGDSVGRLGGDEFAIILKSIQGIDKATIFCQKLLNSLSETYSINHHSIFISGTIGLSIFPDHGHSKEVLIRNADTAMYFAKQEGRNRFKLYNDAIGEVFVKRTRVAEALVNELLAGGEKFYLLFQPIVDIPTQRMVAVESLLRWQDQNKYNINTEEMVAILERRGMILEVGNFVFRKSLDALVEFQKVYPDDFYISINVSPLQLAQTGFADKFIELVSSYDLSHHLINLEITESALIQDTILVKDNLFKIREAGFHLAIDDFGTGFSSLSSLREYPFSHLKIDRSFVKPLPHDIENNFLVKAVMDLSRAFAMKVVAEGIENAEQLKFLEEINCPLGQGYYFGKPKKLSELIEEANAQNLMQKSVAVNRINT